MATNVPSTISIISLHRSLATLLKTALSSTIMLARRSSPNTQSLAAEKQYLHNRVKTQQLISPIPLNESVLRKSNTWKKCCLAPYTDIHQNPTPRTQYHIGAGNTFPSPQSTMISIPAGHLTLQKPGALQFTTI